MKTVIFMAIIAFAVQHTFGNPFGSVDFNLLLDGDRDIRGFVDCVLDKVPCTKMYASYKGIITVAFKEKCKNCTAYEKHLLWRFLQEVKAHSPEGNNYLRKYDPGHKYYDALAEEFRNIGIGIGI